MPIPTSEAVTELLHRVQQGEEAARGQLEPMIYHELRRIAQHHMHHERPGHTLQPTALVHEALLRLMGVEIVWHDRVHFFALAARQMRHILVDHARHRRRQKRGAGAAHVALEEIEAHAVPENFDIVALDEALRRLADMDRRKHDVIEWHYFGGLSLEETARALDVSTKTVQRELRLAEAWLQHALRPARDA